MKKHQNEKGFTLIEVVVSLAIIGIMAVSFLSIFSGSLVGVVKSGKIGTAVYTAQTDAEDQLENSVYSEDSSTTITVNWESENLSVDGNLKTIEADVPNDQNDNKTKLQVFITQKEE